MVITLENPTTHRWTREEYYMIDELGLLADRHVQLIDGEIFDMPPQEDFHSAVVCLAYEALFRLLAGRYCIRCQLPLQLGDDSEPEPEPEPDVSVVEGTARDYVGTGHPTHAILVIEMADTTLAFDRRVKANLYASAGIEDYWIVNLVDRQVEVHRNPVADESEQFGFRYAERHVFARGQTLKTLAGSGEISVADLLPWRNA